MFNKRFICLGIGLISLLAALALAGCGGSGQSGGSAVTRKGQVRLHVIWPAQTKAAAGKYIPPYAQSLLFELSPKGNPATIYTLVVNRPASLPATQDVTFSQLLASGTYELAGAARALQDAQGATVASGAVEVDVQPGMNAVSLTLNSTVKTLTILGQPIGIGVGQSSTLQSGAFDPDGNGLLLPDGALTWSIVTGGQFGSITPGGKLTATAAGTIRVQVAEPVTGVKAVADVTVTSQASTTGLAQSGYPKPASDIGSTGLVAGSGAIGNIAWTFDLRTRGVNTPVLGKNNLIFALNQNGVVFAVKTTDGTKAWEATLPNMIGQLLTGSLVASDDNTVIVGYPFGIQAYDAASGLPKWYNGDFNVNANMNLTAGKLYVPTVNQGMAVVDIRDGHTIGSFPGLQYTYDGAIGNGNIYYATETFSGGPRSAAVYSVNLTSGATVWKKDVAVAGGGGYNGSYPIVDPGGTVFVGLGDGNLLGLDGSSAAQTASQTAFITPGSLQPAIGADHSVYFTRRDPTSNQSETVRFDSSLTQRLWHAPFVLKEPTVGSDGTVYGAGNDLDQNGLQTGQTAVYALNNTDGTLKWKVILDRGVAAAPPGFGQVPGYAAVGSDGTVYVVSIDQRLYAIK